MAEKKRIVWIDQLRGLAFYTVILGHMSIGKSFKTWLYSFHMPLFFMISGLNLNIERVYKTSFKDFTLRLAKKMLVPYMWLQMLSFVLRYEASIVNCKPVPVKEYLIGILVGNNNIIGAPSNPLYYVLLLFLAQVGLWFVIRITKGEKGLIGAILSVLAVGSVCLQKIDLPWHINVVPTAMLLIFIGRLLMDAYLSVRENLHKMNKALYLGICAVLLGVGYVLNRYNGRISIHGNFYGKEFIIFLVCAVSSSVAIAMLVMLLPKSKALTFIGANTFFYMGIHKPLLLVLEAYAGEYENHPVFIIVGSLVCFFGLIPVAWFFSKYMPYTCGNSTTEETTAFKIFKYIAVAVSGIVPYYALVGDYIAGSVSKELIAFAVFAVIAIVTEAVFTKHLPFMFLKEKRREK